MPGWDAIVVENLNAAQTLGDAGHHRSSVSRAYYAAFAASSFVLKVRAPFARGRGTPPHHEVPGLLEQQLSHLSPRGMRNLLTAVSRLYKNRITADYQSGRTVDVHSALQARRDAYAVCRQLGVVNASSH